MAIVDFSTNTFTSYAILNGTTEIELIRIEAHFALNSIPQAVLYCAIGREVGSLLAANVHFELDDIDVNLPIEVRAQGNEVANSGVSGGAWPDGEFTLFQGRIVGLSFSKSRAGTACLVLHCRHFAMDLQYAVTQTQESHPINPGNFGMQAGLKLGGGQPDFVATTAALKFFNAANIEEDMWGDAMSPWLEEIINTPAMFQGEDLTPTQGAEDALTALNSFEPNLEGDYVWGVPLAIDSAFDVLQLDPAIKAIGQDISVEQVKSFYGATIWEKLVQDYASRYLFAVVPMADRCLVVPFTPGLVPTWVTVDPSEYEVIDASVSLSRALTAVVIMTGSQSMTGFFGFQRQGAAMNTVGGLFINENVPDGQFVFREGPHWLTNVASQLGWSPFAVGIPPNGVPAPIGNMAQPGAGAAPGIPGPAEVREAAGNLWDAYAHAVYLREVLSQRWLSIRGKLRLDIAPGSSVEVLTTEEQFVAQQTGVPQQSLFGMVTKVSLIIDSEAVHAETALEIGYMQTELEHNDPSLSTLDHPLYAQPFIGAPLVNDDPIEVDPPIPEDD